jgi:hypothetical protein
LPEYLALEMAKAGFDPKARLKSMFEENEEAVNDLRGKFETQLKCLRM